MFKSLRLLALVALTLLPLGVGAAPASGYWWNPVEGGRGFGIEVQSNSLYMVGYMYDGNGSPVWYVSGPGTLMAGGTYTGQWAQYANGQTLGGSYRTPNVKNANAGALTVQFSDPRTGVLTLPDGRQIPIQRFNF